MLKKNVRNIFSASIFSALFACSPANAFGDLVVDSWSLLCGVSDTAGQQGVFFENVKNLFQASHAAIYGSSSCTANYDFGWSGGSAQFDVIIDHYLQQLHGDTASEGNIYIRPSVDTNISFNGRWQFSWPDATLGQANILLLVYDVAADQPVAYDGASGGNVGLGRPYGDLVVQKSGLLLAGGLYQIHYFARIYHFNPTPPGTHGEGSGEIHFSLTPVPEPATLALLAFALLFPRRRP